MALLTGWWTRITCRSLDKPSITVHLHLRWIWPRDIDLNHPTIKGVMRSISNQESMWNLSALAILVVTARKGVDLEGRHWVNTSHKWTVISANRCAESLIAFKQEGDSRLFESMFELMSQTKSITQGSLELCRTQTLCLLRKSLTWSSIVMQRRLSWLTIHLQR